MIQTFAEGRGVVPKGSVFIPSMGPVLVPTANMGDVNLKLVSSENLHTKWEGKPFAIQVFRVTNDRNPSRVCIHYPTDDTWEGTADGVYTLETLASRPSRFDGTNGLLKDGDGKVILCYTPPP